MGSPNKSQESKKSNIFEKYKERKIKRTEKNLISYKENSGSWVFFNNIFQILFDWIGWIVIAIFILIWWQNRGSPIGCDRITVDLCNSCYTQVKTNLSGMINLINNINLTPRG